MNISKSPGNYWWWEGRYGVRVAVKDGQDGSVRTSRVATWPVPDAVRAAARAVVDIAVAPPGKTSAERSRRHLQADAALSVYAQAAAAVKPPPEGATVIGYLRERPAEEGGGWWWKTTEEGPFTAAKPTITEALEAVVKAAHGEEG